MKTKEEILNEYGCPEIPFDENVTMYYPAILSAMEEYATQRTAEVGEYTGNINDYKLCNQHLNKKEMIREIKFRVWTGLNMEYRIMAGYLGAFYVQGIDDKDAASLSPLNSKYHKEVPLMQFTGLRDKNGKEIYEGDVVQINHESKGVVAWTPMASQWWINFTDDVRHIKTYRELIPDYGDQENCCQYLGVIGNIFENPDLLTHSTSDKK